jgi:hypothetical protein
LSEYGDGIGHDDQAILEMHFEAVIGGGVGGGQSGGSSSGGSHNRSRDSIYGLTCDYGNVEH